MRIILSLVLLLPLFSHAEIQIDYIQTQTGREYYLTSEDCDELELELDFFKSLTKSYTPSARPQSTSSGKCDGGGKIHSVSLKGYLPANIDKLLNTSVQYYGPNCWNSVIYANGLSQANRFFAPLEFEKTLSYYQCKNRTVDEPLQSGDIIRIFDQHHEEQHAFIYISPTFSFTKNGPETRSTYGIEKTSDIFSYYGIKQACINPDTKTINSSCASLVKVNNCQKRVNPPVPNPNGLGVMLNEMEVRMTYLILNYRNFPNLDTRNALIHDLDQKLNSLYFIINNDLANGKLDPETFAREDFYFSKVLSSKEQLSYF